jgi:hypothetical protein
MTLKDIKRELITHYVFAVSIDDFAAFTGLQPKNGSKMVTTDKERFIKVEVIEDIKESEKKYPSNIKWRSSITDEYKKHNSNSYLQSVNLFCGKEMDMDSIPESLKQYL